MYPPKRSIVCFTYSLTQLNVLKHTAVNCLDSHKNYSHVRSVISCLKYIIRQTWSIFGAMIWTRFLVESQTSYLLGYAPHLFVMICNENGFSEIYIKHTIQLFSSVISFHDFLLTDDINSYITDPEKDRRIKQQMHRLLSSNITRDALLPDVWFQRKIGKFTSTRCLAADTPI